MTASADTAIGGRVVHVSGHGSCLYQCPKVTRNDLGRVSTCDCPTCRRIRGLAPLPTFRSRFVETIEAAKPFSGLFAIISNQQDDMRNDVQLCAR
jgi:hypothetical protein